MTPASAIILAGGDGTRLRPLTRRLAGDDRPKQFCALLGRETLLEQTRRRTARLVAPEHTLFSVTRTHEPYYTAALADVPPSLVVAQPSNRGTAPASSAARCRRWRGPSSRSACKWAPPGRTTSPARSTGRCQPGISRATCCNGIRSDSSSSR